MRFRQIFWPCLTGLALVSLAVVGAPALSAGQAETHGRLALVIGNGGYASPQQPLPHALNDARDIATALRKDGFQVTEVRDGQRDGMKAAVATFANRVKPGDVAVFYYAGHGVQGPARANHAVNDDFLMPVNADIQTADSIREQGISLTEVLEGLSKVQAGAELIILDACRDDPAAGPEGAAGLAWPVSAGARNAFIVFAASPGETAGDPPGGQHGVFTGEILKRMGAPGLTASALFTEVANAVEKDSNPTQRPYFAGTGAGAALVLNPGQKPEDANPLELATYRTAMDCNQSQCLDYALPRVVEPRLKAVLVERKIQLRTALAAPEKATAALTLPRAVSARPPSVVKVLQPRVATAAKTIRAKSDIQASPKATEPPPLSQGPIARKAGVVPTPTHLAAVPASPTAMPPNVRDFIDANRTTAAGRLAVGRRFLNGSDGFPTSWKQAQIWLSSAADGGSGEAAVDLGTAYSRGLAVKTDKGAARAWFLKAGSLGDGDGYVGAAGLVTNFDATRALLEKGVALGSVEAMLELGSQLQEWEVMQAIIDKKNAPAQSLGLYHMAADRGSPDALAHIGECYAKGECGLAKNPMQAARWFRQGADRGSVLGQTLLAEAYVKGEGEPKDIKQALVWFQRADCGNRIAPVAVARIYEKGLGGVPKDEAAAQRWYRKAAELGNEFAALKLAAYYDRRSWFNPAATAEARHWWAEAASHGVSRFSLQALLIENFMFAGTGL